MCVCIPGSPQFTAGASGNVSVAHGATSQFDFVLEAFPAPTSITLEKDGVPVPIASTTQTNSITTQTSVVIVNPQFSEAGSYIIEATNTRGSGSRQFILDIQCKFYPKFLPIVPVHIHCKNVRSLQRCLGLLSCICSEVYIY